VGHEDWAENLGGEVVTHKKKKSQQKMGVKSAKANKIASSLQ